MGGPREQHVSLFAAVGGMSAELWFSGHAAGLHMVLWDVSQDTRRELLLTFNRCTFCIRHHSDGVAADMGSALAARRPASP